MISVQQEDKETKLIAKIKDSANDTLNIDLSDLLPIGRDLSQAIVAALVKFSSPYSGHGYPKTIRTILKLFGTYYFNNPADLSNKESLYAFLFDFRSHWYKTKLINQRLDIRNNSWDMFVKFLGFLMDQNVILAVPIPHGNPKLHRKEIIASLALTERTNKDLCINSLVPISLSRTDEEYLDELEMQFTIAHDIFLNCARREIELFKTNKADGDTLINSVDYHELLALIKPTLNTGRPYCIKACHLQKSYKSITIRGKGHYFVNYFGSHHPYGYQNVLARVRYEHNNFYPTTVNNKVNFTDPALSSLLRTIPSPQKYSAHLGLPTTRNLIPFFVLLMLKNPRINVGALLKVEVEGKNGVNQLLSTAGDESKNVRMKVKKGRAKCEKSSVCDNESKAVIEHILQMTSPLREYLRKQGDERYNKLWLCGGHSGSEVPWVLSSDMLRVHFGQKAFVNESGDICNIDDVSDKKSFLLSHNELRPYIGIANLPRLRTTAGLLVWFKSGGDAKAVARALGNSVSVSLDHYIPKPIQLLMNKRIIRRFQNLLIITATAGEPFMLEASDFRNMEDLHTFLLQMLEGDRASGNELLAELQSRVNKSKTASVACASIPNSNNKIAIKVTAENLALLFLYQEHVDKSEIVTVIRDIPDKTTHTSPSFWAELSRLLKNIIPNDISRRELVAIYDNALRIASRLRKSISFPQFKLIEPL